MSNIAIIPARGGSRRIPQKNIMEFMGKPLIAHTIEAALEAQVFDYVMVSTDATHIAEVAQAHGAEVPFLRDQYADDFSNVSQVIAYELDRLTEKLGLQFDRVCQLMPNCPLRNASDIREGLAFFGRHEASHQISAFQFGWMNPWWAFSLEQGHPKRLFEEATRTRSQDLPELYCPTGAMWIADAQALRQSRNFYADGYQVFVLDWKSALDIDDYADVEMAKAVYQMIHAN